MKVFLHIGYPKCFSTTIQKELYCQHPEIFYGGIGYGDGNIDFYNDELNLFFESGLIYFRNKHYQSFESRFKNVFQNFYKEAKISNHQICGFSSEHALFNFTPQTTDIDVKLDRMRRMFGTELKIIWIIREPISLILSLYKEYVNMGYVHNFDYFLKWVYKYQDRNFYFDLHYNKVLENILEYFPKENLLITQFEKYKNSNKSNLNLLFKEVCEFLNIRPIKAEISNRNPSLSKDELCKRLDANRVIKYDFGSELLEGIEDHRRRIFFNGILKLGLKEEALFHNILKKRKSKENAIVNSKQHLKKDIYSIDKNNLYKITRELDQDFNMLIDKLPSVSLELYNSQRQTILSNINLF